MSAIKKPIQDIVRDNMMDFGAYVILQRALPDFRDGLKPGARRILITMHNEGATKFTKSANIEGQVMKIHPHGSTYDTMVKMAQIDRHAQPYVVGDGNFGEATSKDLEYAASRYTEIKLSELSTEMLKQLKKNVIDYIPNFDGSIMMPEVLPVKWPTVLTTAQSGVAYGMASSTLSYNLKELVVAMTKFIREDKKTLLVPDFATKGYIVNNPDAFKKINVEGSGSVFLRGKATITGNEILITEIPYGTTREAIIDKIVELVKDGKLKEVSKVSDLTDLKGMKIEVIGRRGTDMNMLLEKLYQLTPLQSSMSANMNVLINGGPKVMSVWEIIDEWLKWRKSVIIRGLNNDISKMEKQLHFFRGLEKVLLDIDKAIEIIRRSTEDLIVPNLMETFQIDKTQADDIADMKLRNINKDYILRKIGEIDKLENDIFDLKDLTTNVDRLNEYIIEELEESAEKYGKDRMTKLINVNTEKVKAVKKKLEEVPNYPVKIFVTKEGYVKKFAYNALKEDQYVKPGDEIIDTFDTYNTAELLVFGSDSCCYKVKINEIEESTPKTLGIFLPSISGVKDIVGYSILDGVHKFVIIVYDNNKIAKIKLDSFLGNRKKLANSLSPTLKVVGMLTFKEEGKFIFKTTTTAFKIPTVNYELKERWTQGVFGPQKGIVTEVRYEV